MESIHNYYEQEVTSQIELMSAQFPDFKDSDLSDVACIALNKFPAKYYRHGIDLSFYTSEVEQMELKSRVSAAILEAVTVVKKHPRPE